MTTMLEKAARAAFETYMSLAYSDEERPASEVVEEIWEEGRDGFIQSARSVLMAVREPDGAVFDAYSVAMAATEYQDPSFYYCEPKGFTAMIDHILNEGKSDV